jgi:competence protein ComEC
LCIASIVPVIAKCVGYLLHYVIHWLNTFIEYTGNLPYAITSDIQMNFPQLICLYVFIAAIAWWLLQNKKTGVSLALLSILLFSGFHIREVWNALHQKKLIVYNIPKHSAIDVIIGKQFLFTGDSALQQNEQLQKFHLQPSRSLHRVNNTNNTGKSLGEKNFYRYGNTSFLLIDQRYTLQTITPKTPVDIIILLNNPPIKIEELTSVFTCRQFVFDASNPPWKVAKWQQECHQLGVPCFSVADKGAFVFTLH